MTVVNVVDMITVLDCRMTAAWAVYMIMFMGIWTTHRLLPPTYYCGRLKTIDHIITVEK